MLLAESPLSLHPQNPHYFLFRGKPTVIVASGEHYGAVLNLDFDYDKYLNTLREDELNCTRTWAGAYCEPTSAFSITSNTLAPHKGRFICPWARSDQPGYANGGNKFDLNRWDPKYFKRLKDFVSKAGKRAIIVELNLFCPFYEESMWELSPMNVKNNVNSTGNVARTNVYTMDKHGGLLAVQEAMVKKIVNELKSFDNFYYEICNEPYFGGVTLEWQRHIADVIAEAEHPPKVRHLISQNIANFKTKVENPHPGVSIFNFHYATPPDTVALNWDLNKALGDNETGFRGTNDAPYRMEGWDFIVAGGALFNNLDYSFVAGKEDGTFVFPASQPGGGTPELRRQFHFLGQTIRSFDFIHMHPANELVNAALPAGVTIRALAKPGEEYLVYIRTGVGEKQNLKNRFDAGELALEMTLPQAECVAEWLDPKTGTSVQRSQIKQAPGSQRLVVPAFHEDIALTLRKMAR